MLDGWYCRSMANVQQASVSAAAAGASTRTLGNAAAEQLHREQRAPEQRDYSSDSSSSDGEPEVNYRTHYLALKKKLKYLIYENECFQDALRSSQRRLLKVSRDRTFLLDRLLQYERPETSSESEGTESSDDEGNKAEQKRKKSDANSTHHRVPTPPTANKGSTTAKRKRNPAPKKPPQNTHMPQTMGLHSNVPKAPLPGSLFAGAGDGHMTPEEVERHLQSRQSYLELLPERAPPTVPTEMFSNDPSLDSESNDILENSPNIDEWIE